MINVSDLTDEERRAILGDEIFDTIRDIRKCVELLPEIAEELSSLLNRLNATAKEPSLSRI